MRISSALPGSFESFKLDQADLRRLVPTKTDLDWNRSRMSFGLVLLLVVFGWSTAQAQVERALEKDVEVSGDEVAIPFEVIAKGLNNPCGVAIQPETGIVFVADSGNQRVVRVEDGELVEAITDFPQDVYGKGPKVNIGPLGLAFLSKSTLLVGGGGLPDGEELLRVFELPDDR
jgi:hypothetical protein